MHIRAFAMYDSSSDVLLSLDLHLMTFNTILRMTSYCGRTRSWRGCGAPSGMHKLSPLSGVCAALHPSSLPQPCLAPCSPAHAPLALVTSSCTVNVDTLSEM